jgi:uncharacterized YccA/Bax inhibitor family protein
MRSGNPVLKEDTFSRSDLIQDGSTMTLRGVVVKTTLALLVTIATAGVAWTQLASGLGPQLYPWIVGGLIGGLVLSLITCFVPKAAPWTTIPYAACEGLFLGAVSLAFETRYPGIVMNAVGLTFGTFAGLLAAYSTGFIKATENFKLGIFAATAGIALVYLANMLLRVFLGTSLPFIHDAGIIGIGFSLFVVVIAALNLVLDFDFIEHGVERGAPKYMEWYGAFGLLVTLVWLYLEILRLLAKLQGGDRRSSS